MLQRFMGLGGGGCSGNEGGLSIHEWLSCRGGGEATGCLTSRGCMKGAFYGLTDLIKFKDSVAESRRPRRNVVILHLA